MAVDLPPYIPRDVDAQIDAAVGIGGLVLIEGASASGKTRTAFAALQRSCAEWFMSNPRDVAELREVAGELAQVPQLVIWLDDFEFYLASPTFDEHLLAELCGPEREGVVLLATMRSEERRFLERSMTAGDQSQLVTENRFRRVRKILEIANIIRLPARLSADETRQAGEWRWDERIADALDQSTGGGLTEYICAAPAALQRWQSGSDGEDPVGAAIVSAAVDCRRAGYRNSLARDLLEALYLDYIDPRLRHRRGLSSFNEGLEWAMYPVRGASSCLEPVGEGLYRPFDYLTDYAQRAAATSVPELVWTTLLDLGDPEASYSVAGAAYEQDMTQHAYQGYRLAAEAGNVDAMFMAGTGALDLGLVDQGIDWLRAGAEQGYWPAMGTLGTQLYMAGHPEEGKQWMRRSAEAGDLLAAGALGIGLYRIERRPDLAEPWLRMAIKAREPAVMSTLADLLRGSGRAAEAEAQYKRAIRLGHVPAMYGLGSLHFQAERWADAWSLWEQAAELGHVPAMGWLGTLLLLRGDEPDAERWLRAAADADDDLGAAMLRTLLVGRRKANRGTRPPGLEGAAAVLATIGDVLKDRGDLEGARGWWSAAEARGSKAAARRLRSDEFGS
ncbi:tetratricopeptide repeat protein [Actinoplanes sp. NPDC051343]|uniref:tetratricopeptide repeat protein n=1 Tax=Actinoplanes sp. NPDC051343 TaxID=3363906 RepID=UPI0037B89083